MWDMEITERYKAYLKTTDKPKNWEFMAFIDDMVDAYGKENDLPYNEVGGYQIADHDDFTEFIERSVNEKI